MRIAALYVLFALLATVANLGSQMLVDLVISGDFSLLVALIVGTAAGVIVKYALDRRFIFRYQIVGAAHGVRTFFLYGLMSGVTTLIFWAFEYGAELLFHNDLARYGGAVVGLLIGYVTKYYLDKNVTFSEGSSARAAASIDDGVLS